MTHTVKVRIGEHWVDVPPEYLKGEAEHCKDILDQYYLAATDDNVSEEQYEQLRKATLDCRVEFWKKWNDTIADNKTMGSDDVHQSDGSNQ